MPRPTPLINTFSRRPGGAGFGVHKRPTTPKDKPLVERLKEEGRKLPLEFLLDVMEGNLASLSGPLGGAIDAEELTLGTRIEAAKAALPYLHRKMPVMHEVEVTNPVTFEKVDLASLAVLSDSELDAFIAMSERVAQSRASQVGEGTETAEEAVYVLPGQGSAAT